MLKFFDILKFVLYHPLNEGKKIDALKRLLRWQIGARLLSCEVVYPWIFGLKVITRIGETGFSGNIYAGLMLIFHLIINIGLVIPFMHYNIMMLYNYLVKH
jgi:hypothetical protein